MCKINRKIISLILALCLLLTLTACKSGNENQAQGGAEGDINATAYNFNLLYCTKDSFDPYQCKTKQNFELSHLLYDPLVKTDNEFNAIKVLANSVTIEDKICTVVLKAVKFTDGTPVTADDVVFSFNKAKNSSAVYAYSLKNAVSIQKQSDTTVIFNLSKADPYFANVLDFPILKKDSDQLKNSDNRALPPIGAGRYLFNESYDALVVNKAYHGGASSIKNIGLIDSPDQEADYHNIEIGVVDYYYSDLSTSSFPKMNGLKTSVNLNNLVFLGINFNARYLSNMSVRQAISAAIDRTKIANGSYFTNASAALGPFSSAWQPAKDYQSISATANNDIAASNLKNAEIFEKNDQGKYIKANKTINFSILVNNDNSVRVAAAELIAKQLNDFGFTVSVEKVSRTTYDARISAKNFDMYIGEIRLSNNMDLSELVSLIETKGYMPETEVSVNNSSGSNETVKTVSTKLAVNEFYSGEYSLGDMINVFNSELPIIPICHRKGIAMYNENIKDPFAPSVSDLFYRIENVN